MKMSFDIGRSAAMAWAGDAIVSQQIKEAIPPTQQGANLETLGEATPCVKRLYSVWTHYERQLTKAGERIRTTMSVPVPSGKNDGTMVFKPYRAEDVPTELTMLMTHYSIRRDIAHLRLLEELRRVVPKRCLAAFCPHASVDSFFSGWTIVYCEPDPYALPQDA